MKEWNDAFSNLPGTVLLLSICPSLHPAQFIDINSSYLAPPGWTEDTAPRLKQWTDISIYELHIRDFSVTDESVPERLRGKYLAFSPPHIAASYSAGSSGSPASSPADLSSTLTAGLKHLAKLRDAGLNHLHLLPTYDFGSVPEREEDQATVKVWRGSLVKTSGPDSLSVGGLDLLFPLTLCRRISPFTVQTARISRLQYRQWRTGMGSIGATTLSISAYQTGAMRQIPMGFSGESLDFACTVVIRGIHARPNNPSSALIDSSIVEFRSMVMALHRAGWRVVLDVVYNHTFRAGPHDRCHARDLACMEACRSAGHIKAISDAVRSRSSRHDSILHLMLPLMTRVLYEDVGRENSLT